MARRLFFVDEVRRERAELNGDEAQHLTRVLRVEPGQRYEISDNRTLYLAEIETARKSQVVFRVIEKLPAPAPGVRITLLAALTKFDRFEWMLEKATELGVSRVIPVEAERSEKGLAQAAHKRLERWRRIVLESSQQSRRVQMPAVDPPIRMEQAANFEATLRFFLDEKPGSPTILEAAPETRNSDDTIAVLLGPEGGWVDAERDVNHNWTSVSLGPLILRAETAAIASLAVLSMLWLTPLKHSS